MKVLSKVHVLAERNDWSIARAQGFVDGEMARRRGAAPSSYARVGIDDYSIGFRAGYFERRTSRPKSEGEKKVVSGSAMAGVRQVAVKLAASETAQPAHWRTHAGSAWDKSRVEE